MRKFRRFITSLDMLFQPSLLLTSLFSLQVTQLTEKLKNQSESHKQAQENLHEQVQEQKAHLRAAQDRVLSLEANITELTSQLNESKEKVSQLDVQVMDLYTVC